MNKAINTAAPTASEMGKKGGSNTYKKHGKAHFAQMGKKSGETRRMKAQKQAKRAK
jgi:hypothetical protein